MISTRSISLAKAPTGLLLQEIRRSSHRFLHRKRQFPVGFRGGEGGWRGISPRIPALEGPVASLQAVMAFLDATAQTGASGFRPSFLSRFSASRSSGFVSPRFKVCFHGAVCNREARRNKEREREKEEEIPLI
jgi:hypothetical protein